MFGYVTVDKPELRIREYYEFRAFYCGLCETLGKRYGIKGRMTLTYDMTFLIMLLTSLYECETKLEKRRCMVHPVKKHMTLTNEITEYGADMNVALAYHHFQDDFQDEKSLSGFAGVHIYQKSYRRIADKYERQCNKIEECLKKLQEIEKRQERNLDLPAGAFGELMGEIFVYRKDQWEESLRMAGFYLGKFIYLMDAYDDLKKDKEKGNYNPLLFFSEQKDFKEACKQMLESMMAECTRALERLPLIKDIDILRNILYRGVWTKYRKLEQDKQEG